MQQLNGDHVQHLYGDTNISSPDGLESYTVKNVIGRGRNSTVHLATCTRGRLRGRKVALKIIPLSLPTSDFKSLYVTTTTLQKSLHHPALVSLHSTFTTSDAYYVILELCEGGTLKNFLHRTSEPDDAPQSTPAFRLTETQLRPVIRSIAEGLSHLHARGIMHRSINPDNVFITTDGRVKLGGFRLAGTPTSCTMENEIFTITHEACNYVSPEVIKNQEFGFPADLWSLGCFVVTLLTGAPPFQAENVAEVLSLVSTGSYTLPADVKLSSEVMDLVNKLLKPNPCYRISLERVLSHPFLDSSLPTESLQHSLAVHNPYKPGFESALPLEIHKDSKNNQETSNPHPDSRSTADSKRSKPQGLPYRMPSGIGSAVISNASAPTTSHMVSRPRIASDSSTATSSGIREAWTKLTTRQRAKQDQNSPTASAAGTHTIRPKGQRRVLAEVENGGGSSRLSFQGGSSPKMGKIDTPDKRETFISGLLSPPNSSDSPPHSERERLKNAPSCSSSLPSPRCTTPVPSFGSHSRKKDTATSTAVPDADPIFILRTIFPKPFQTVPLSPETHKILHGQLVVMPSRSLLVDLREGERRAGGKGDRVLCISSDGKEIKVYDAPHLSTPCIISEPRESYTIDELPERYWENYAFASKFIDSIKKRTPKMIWYTAEAKFTLMSNDPRGDLQATFPCPSSGARKRHVSRNVADSTTMMKMKVSREQGVLEISRFVASPAGRTKGEWISKCLNVTEEHLKSGNYIGLDLTPEELEGLNCVIGGLKVCEAVEALFTQVDTHKDCVSEGTGNRPGKTGTVGLQLAEGRSSPRTEAFKSGPTAFSGLAFSVTPRPRRITSNRGTRISPGLLAEN